MKSQISANFKENKSKRQRQLVQTGEMVKFVKEAKKKPVTALMEQK